MIRTVQVTRTLVSNDEATSLIQSRVRYLCEAGIKQLCILMWYNITLLV